MTAAIKLFGEGELLDQKRLLRRIDEFADRIQAVVGLDDQTGGAEA